MTRPVDGDTSTKKRIIKSIQAKGRPAKAWTAIGWPTNIQSGTPDGMFGPVKQMKGWGDCWFLASLAAVANDQAGRKILAESIKKANGGYAVTFKGLPNHSVFIADSELDKCIDENGGDADTRLLELAADKFLSRSGNFHFLYTACVAGGGGNQEQAKECIQDLCDRYGIQDPITHNPMRRGAPSAVAFFLFTGIYPDFILATSGRQMQEDDVMGFLNAHITNDRGGASVAIVGINNPLGSSRDLRRLLRRWDVIRTEITSNGTLSQEQLAFLNALDRWLETRVPYNMKLLWSAAQKLELQHLKLSDFVNLLAQNRSIMSQQQFDLLQSGVRQVLDGKSGYIGFTGHHVGTIEGINQATNTFTYSEPHYPRLVHTGVLSDLVQAIISKNVFLNAVRLTTRQDDREHVGTSRGRRLRQLHNQVVRDGRIDQTESSPLADLMEMDEGVFRQIYDSDKNGVIAGGELKAVQRRVDRWVDQLELTPIW